MLLHVPDRAVDVVEVDLMKAFTDLFQTHPIVIVLFLLTIE